MKPTDLKPELLIVKGLHVGFTLNKKNFFKVLDGVDLEIRPSEIVGLVGESGSGKTVLSLSLMRLITPPGEIKSGEIIWCQKDLLKLKSRAMRQVRGREIAMIFQNPRMSLNPVRTIGSQMTAIITRQSGCSKRDAYDEAINALRVVKLPDAERRYYSYPHQLSDGMCQRVMIAMALSCHPKLLIADEPTASLDVTIQAQIMDLLLEIRETFKMAILLISHDLGVVAHLSDRIAVMYLGRIVELAPAGRLFTSPLHPYTQALIGSLPLPTQNWNRNYSRVKGEMPSQIEIPLGCRFRTRCPKAFEECSIKDPKLIAINADHYAACLLY
jgi:oligopeptide/dipeptide ABC transporter ATP-binding protein